MAPVKTKISWTSEMEDQLVDLWQQHECLFNVSSKTYHNRTDKEKSWSEIATAMDVPVEEVKTRTTTLRTQFSKLLKAKPSGSGEKPLTSKQKWLLKALVFLKPHVTQRQTESSLHHSVKEALAADDLDDESSTPDDFSVEGSANESQTHSSWNDDDDDEEESVTPSTLTNKRKKKQSDSIEQQKFKILQKMSAAFLADRHRPVSDGDSTFGAQVTEELRAIKNSTIKTRVKRKIMNALYEAQECDQPYMPPPLFYPPSVQMPHTPSTPPYPHPPPPHHQYQPPLGQAGFQALLDGDEEIMRL